MIPQTGVFRYVTHDRLLLHLAHGWLWKAYLGPIHGEWSSLLWWCSGDCQNHEVPSIHGEDANVDSRLNALDAAARFSID